MSTVGVMDLTRPDLKECIEALTLYRRRCIEPTLQAMAPSLDARTPKVGPS